MLLLLFVAHSAAKKRAKLLLFFDIRKFFCNYFHKKSVRVTFYSRKLLRIGFEACFFLCNPTTSSLPLLGHGVEYRHAISEAFALGLNNVLSFPVPICYGTPFYL